MFYFETMFLFMIIGFLVIVLLYFLSLKFKNHKSKINKVIGSIVFVLMTIGWYAFFYGYESKVEANSRNDLKKIDQALISKIKLQNGMGLSGEQIYNSQEINDKKSILEIFKFLKRIKRVKAHHSSPKKKITMSFTYKDKLYKYTIGKDSVNRDEYWVMIYNGWCKGDPRDKKNYRASISNVEVGRVQTESLPTVLNEFMKSMKY